MKQSILPILAALVAAFGAFADDPYIESDGTSGISTGYHLKPSSRVEVDFALPTTEQTQGARLFGADYNTTTLKIALGFYIGANSGNPCWVVGFGSAESGWTGGWPKDSGGNYLYLDTARHTMVYDFAGDRHTYYTDGTAIAWQTDGKTYSDEATQPFAIFAAKNASGFERPIKARIYGVKIYEKEGDDYVLVHDFVPHSATGLPGFRDDVTLNGFKDAVTGAFIANADAPSGFTAGGDCSAESHAYVATGAAADKQFIDTLYHATAQTRCELDYSLQAIPTATAWFFSASGAENSAYFGMFINNGATAFGRHNGTSWANVSSSEAAVLNTCRTAVLDYPANKMLVLSGNVTNFEASANAVAGKTYNTGTLRIAVNYNGSSEFGSFKIYGFRIFEGGVLTRNFVPCWRDGVPGLKDTLTGVFVTYPGTLGTKLAYGGDIAVEANPYIETDATCKQYLDTGYKPINTTRFELDYALTATRPSGTWVLFRGNNSGKYFGAYNNGSGFGFINGNGWKSGVTTTTLADATGIRRTAILDNVANLAVLTTAGVTNGSMSCANAIPATAGGTAVTLSESEGFSASEYSSLRIYGCRVYEGGVAVHEFLPAIKEGIPGLQDQLSDAFLPVLSKGSTNPYVSGGAFVPTVTPASSRVNRGGTTTLTASSPNAVSYRWLRNGEAVEGGTTGTLVVRWRKGGEADSYQAIAIVTTDGMTAESVPSASVTVAFNLPETIILVQ